MKRTVTDRVREIEDNFETVKADSAYWQFEARRFRIMYAKAHCPEFADWWNANSGNRDIDRACEWLREHAPFNKRKPK